MKISAYFPTELLKPFVKHFLIVDCDKDALNTMLPDTSLIMGFRFRGSTKYLANSCETQLPFAVLAGLRKSVQLMQDSSSTGNLLVVFNPLGAGAFIKEPLHHVFGDIISLSDISNFNQLSQIEDNLCGVQSDKDRIDIIENFLLSKLTYYKPDKVVYSALQTIQFYNGIVRIGDLASKLFISIDALEKKFRHAVGASPKQVCNIVRMNNLLQNMHSNSLSEIALNAGFYDQAHFNKEFKLFTGQNPLEFLKNVSAQNQ